jgi:hypothetical protein
MIPHGLPHCAAIFPSESVDTGRLSGTDITPQVVAARLTRWVVALRAARS